MRATTKMTNSTSLLYMSRNFYNLNKSSGQLANQRQVMELKDDPMSANIGIQMETLVSRAEQYNRNIKNGLLQLNLSDGYLQTAKAQMDKIKNTLTEAANEPSTSAETRSANVTKLNEIFKTLVSIGNSSDGSRYLFGGSKTTSSPFEIVNGRYVNYTGNQDKINIVVDQAVTMPINVTGSDIYGNMTTTIPSKDMNPDINMSTDNSTRLSDLNGGEGVPTGKITIKYSAYPDGLEVDLTGCDTLEDVKDAIEKQTLDASRKLDPNQHNWLDGSTLDWHDCQDRYVKVTVNPDNNGISLMEYDLGEALPEPTQAEIRKGLAYSGGDWAVGKTGVAEQAVPGKETTVFDKANPQGVYNSYANLSVEDHASNKVAEGLGIRGSASIPKLDANGIPVIDTAKAGYIHGRDLNPVLSERTLLADLDGYNDSVYTFTNGPKNGSIQITEVSQDSNNVFNNWDLDGVSIGKNTGANGELYVRAVNRGTASEPDIYVEVFTKPISKATAADLVATGTYDNSRSGGLVNLQETNSSGLSGSMGIVLPDNVKEATVNLEVEFPDSLQGSVHVPAFVEEQNPDGSSKDILNIASGWNIKGLDKPPAEGYNENHPASTDLEGNVSVNYRYDDEGYLNVELSRPAYGDQPAKLLATGRLYVGDNLDAPGASLAGAVSGRVEFVGAEGYEGVSGSVFIELPAGTSFTGAGSIVGDSKDNATANSFQLQQDAPGGTVVLGGATELAADTAMGADNSFILAGDTMFKKGQVFDNPVKLPSGGYLPAGEPLPDDTVIAKGSKVEISGSLKEGTVLAAGQKLNVAGIPAGTVLPRGSYYEAPAGTGFPADGMGMSVTQPHPTKPGETVTTSVVPSAGYDVKATFATIEDFNRAVEELGIHVSANVSANGKGLEFTSRLAGAWLTVSEDTDCYEQMGDVGNQLSGLDLNGLVKGENTDTAGNVYSEVIFYPPNNPEYDANGNIIPVRLIGDDGSITEIEPGYYIRVYSDQSALDKTYENRDDSSMIAEGFVPAGAWNPDFPTDPNAQPFVPDAKNGLQNVGFLNGVVLEERNKSGVNGTVNLDYYGGKDQYTQDADGNNEFNPYWNDNITVFPGGMRPSGSDYATIQQVDVYNVTPGVNTDYNGQIHGTITKVDDTDPNINTGFEIAFYRDSSHSNITGKSNPREAVGAGGMVNVYSVDSRGNYLDKDGNIIKDPDKVATEGVIIGTMSVDASKLADQGVDIGATDSFTLKTGANRNYGQEREENVFSTLNDAIDALNRNDTEALHNLLEDAQRDIDRILGSISEVGARGERMNLLSERHSDDVVNFSDLFTKRVGMDDAALAKAVLSYQAATNAYQAAMQVSASVMQMSLLQYI